MKNEPAFPIGSGDMRDPVGMTMRDYFAAKAMAALVSAKGRRLNELDDEYTLAKTGEEENEIGELTKIIFWNLSLDAYKIADAMLREREVRE